jgi:hypothetical protein
VFPAVRFADGITGAEVGVIQGVRGGEGFRTNLGLAHLGGPTVCQVTVEIAGPYGELIGEPVLMYVSEGKYTQRNRILRAAGVEETEHGFAVVTSDTEGCTLWAYGSIIDEGTGDAITAPLTKRP